MFSSIKKNLKKSLLTHNKDLDIEINSIQLELLFDQKGDLTTNICMQYAKLLSMSPIKIAEIILKNFTHPLVEKSELAGPGFINFFLNEDGFDNLISFKDERTIKAKSLNIEFVSANPTGPLHLAHGRGAVVGDVLSNLYEFNGYKVNREYYVNNTGNQINEFLSSILFTISEKYNLSLPFNQFYKGEYIKEIADSCYLKFKNLININISNDQKNQIVNFAIKNLVTKSLSVLKSTNIHFNSVIYETEIMNKDHFSKALSILKKDNLVYEGKLQQPKDYNETKKDNNILIFKSSQFGDDEDRALTKNDGTPTYFANDIAYHLDKVSRGFDILINIWGADHLGYLTRLKSALTAVHKQIDFNVVFCQIVNLKRDNIIQKLSKREGTIFELDKLINEIGVDNFRYFMCYRKNDTHMDLDIDLIKKENKENPIYYIQYASARSHSILKKKNLINKNSIIWSPELKILYKKIFQWNEVILQATNRNEVHLIAHYLEGLASSFHSYWSASKDRPELKFLDNDKNMNLKTEILLSRFLETLNAGLNILGIKPKTEM
jgi:arginyl-tRNA synthetase